MISGIVPMITYYGVKLINPHFLLLSCTITCALVSLITGSSWTTIATIGLAFIGIGSSFGIHEGWVAGAIISGAL
jgi:Na+:H+ antiporter, NhaC family